MITHVGKSAELENAFGLIDPTMLKTDFHIDGVWVAQEGNEFTVTNPATLKTLVLELGGYAPFIVFDDADMERGLNVRSPQNLLLPGRIALPPTEFLCGGISISVLLPCLFSGSKNCALVPV